MPKMKRPNLNSYFLAKIDYYVNGMLSSMSIRRPSDVRSIRGDVTDRLITVTMLDGTEYMWEGGHYASRKRNGCYAPLMPKPLN